MSFSDSIGRLAAPPTAAPFEAIRMMMVDKLMAGSNRKSMPHNAWQSALDEAAGAVAQVVVTEGTARVRGAAVHSRISKKLLNAKLPDAGYQERLVNRLLAASIPLERLEQSDYEPLTERSRGVALETAWEEVVKIGRDELERWRGIALEVQGWRRPTAKLWVVSGVAFSVTTIAALWLGGLMSAPDWFDPISGLFWGIPW